MKEIVHFATGQRYSGMREDQKHVTMIPIACQGTRVFLPKGHKAVHSYNVNCKKCIEVILKELVAKASALNRLKRVAIEDDTQFMITARERGRRLLEMYNHDTTPDPEILERIKHQ